MMDEKISGCMLAFSPLCSRVSYFGLMTCLFCLYRRIALQQYTVSRNFMGYNTILLVWCVHETKKRKRDAIVFPCTLHEKRAELLHIIIVGLIGCRFYRQKLKNRSFFEVLKNRGVTVLLITYMRYIRGGQAR